MSDNLRDRIAYAIAQADGDEPGMEPASCDYEMADAVIRELGSDCIYRYACAHCGDFWFDKSERMQRFALLHNKSHLSSPPVWDNIKPGEAR